MIKIDRLNYFYQISTVLIRSGHIPETLFYCIFSKSISSLTYTFLM